MPPLSIKLADQHRRVVGHRLQAPGRFPRVLQRAGQLRDVGHDPQIGRVLIECAHVRQPGHRDPGRNQAVIPAPQRALEVGRLTLLQVSDIGRVTERLKRVMRPPRSVTMIAVPLALSISASVCARATWTSS